MGATEAAETDPLQALRVLASAWGIPCDDAQLAALVEYADLLLSWGARINLTGARSRRALIDDHLPDAFALASRLEGRARVVDVGSGGGLPAIPLAILRPLLTIVLSEPVAKKGAFLRTAIRQLGLGARVTLVGRRGEVLAAEAPAEFDVAISRATFAPNVWLALGQRLVRPDGRVFALTTPQTPIGDWAAGALSSQVYAGGRRSIVELVLEPDR